MTSIGLLAEVSRLTLWWLRILIGRSRIADQCHYNPVVMGDTQVTERTPRRTQISAQLLAFVLLGSVQFQLACEGPLPIEYETQHLRIGTSLDYPLCAGNLAGYEQVIQKVESELGIAAPKKAEVYIWDQDSWFQSGIGHCHAPHLGGCTNQSANTVYTSVDSLEHELVHLVLRNPQLDDFFDEGIAEAYSGMQTRFGESLPSSNAGTSWETMDWLTAPHFIRWLREHWGDSKLRQLAKTRGSTFEAFEDVYGLPLRSAERLYLREAPAGYAQLGGCPNDELVFDEYALRWYAPIILDCEVEDTLGGPGGLRTDRSLVIEEAGTYSLSTDAAWLLVGGCSEGAIASIEPQSELLERDVPPDYATYPNPARRWFEGDTVHDVHLLPGRYVLTVGSDSFAPAELNVAVWRAAITPVSM